MPAARGLEALVIQGAHGQPFRHDELADAQPVVAYGLSGDIILINRQNDLQRLRVRRRREDAVE